MLITISDNLIWTTSSAHFDLLTVYSPLTSSSLTGVIYASTSCHADEDPDEATERLNDAVSRLLNASPLSDPKPDLLWSMAYRTKGRPINVEAGPVLSRMSGKVMVFPPPSVDLAFDDPILDSVREMWKRIMGDEVDEAEFLRFEDRGLSGEEEV